MPRGVTRHKSTSSYREALHGVEVDVARAVSARLLPTSAGSSEHRHAAHSTKSCLVWHISVSLAHKIHRRRTFVPFDLPHQTPLRLPVSYIVYFRALATAVGRYSTQMRTIPRKVIVGRRLSHHRRRSPVNYTRPGTFLSGNALPLLRVVTRFCFEGARIRRKTSLKFYRVHMKETSHTHILCSRAFGPITPLHSLSRPYVQVWQQLYSRHPDPPGIPRCGTQLNPTLEEFTSAFETLLQARLQLSPPRVKIVPPEQVEVLAVKTTDLFKYRLVGEVLGPCARAIREQVSSAERDRRRRSCWTCCLVVLVLPHRLVFGGVLIRVWIVPRDGPVVELHEGVFAVGAPSRLAEVAPDVAGQGFKHLRRCYLWGGRSDSPSGGL